MNLLKYVYLFCYSEPPMSSDIAQVADGTITVISEDFKLRIISIRIPPKSFLYPPKDFSIRKQRIESKNEVTNANG